MTGFDSQRPDMNKRVMLIAEVKTASPFGWKSEKSWEELFEIAERASDMISIHTDARWGGSFELLERARGRTRKPLLAKGIHASDEDVRRAITLGADAVLVVGRIPAIHAEHCLIEPRSLAELALIPKTLRTVWNSRELATGGLKAETFPEARAAFPGWLCQASNIRSAKDMAPGAEAVLVGTHLEEFIESLSGGSA